MTAKHVDFDADGRVIITSSNDDYPDLTTAEVEIQGRAVSHRPRSRVITAES